MGNLVILTLIFLLIGSPVIFRSGHPGKLIFLHLVLFGAVSVAAFLLCRGWIYDLMRTWYTPQGGGDPFGSGQMVAFWMTTAALGNLVSLAIITALGLWITARRQRVRQG
jgi:hypothetical protein